MRLFRQRQHGDWSGVVEDLRRCVSRSHFAWISALWPPIFLQIRDVIKSTAKRCRRTFPGSAHGVKPKLLRRHLEEQIIALVPSGGGFA